MVTCPPPTHTHNLPHISTSMLRSYTHLTRCTTVLLFSSSGVFADTEKGPHQADYIFHPIIIWFFVASVEGYNLVAWNLDVLKDMQSPKLETEVIITHYSNGSKAWNPYTWHAAYACVLRLVACGMWHGRILIYGMLCDFQCFWCRPPSQGMPPCQCVLQCSPLEIEHKIR